MSKYILLLVIINLRQAFILGLAKKIINYISQKGLERNKKTLKRNDISDPIFNYSAPLYGGIYLDYYYLIFKIGKQKFSVIGDTGSDKITFPCTECIASNCGKHEFNVFNKNMDTNVENINIKTDCIGGSFSNFGRKASCHSEISYQEGSSLIIEHFKTKIPLKNNKNYKAGLGCTKKETNLFLTQYANGIIGLGHDTKFLKSLEKFNDLKTISLSLCLSYIGGVYGFNDDLENLVIKNEDNPIKVLNYGRNSNFYNENYYVDFQRMSLDSNKKITYSKNYKLLFDTGTTYTYFPEPMYNSLIEMYKVICDKYPNRCKNNENYISDGLCILYDKSEEPNFNSALDMIKSFPIIELLLGKGDNQKIYKMYPEEYFYPRIKNYDNFDFEKYKKMESNYDEYNGNIYNSDKVDAYCLSIQKSNDSKIIVGGFGMINYLFKFNREKKILSFQRAVCNAKVFKKELIRFK